MFRNLNSKWTYSQTLSMTALTSDVECSFYAFETGQVLTIFMTLTIFYILAISFSFRNFLFIFLYFIIWWLHFLWIWSWLYWSNEKCPWKSSNKKSIVFSVFKLSWSTGQEFKYSNVIFLLLKVFSELDSLVSDNCLFILYFS